MAQRNPQLDNTWWNRNKGFVLGTGFVLAATAATGFAVTTAVLGNANSEKTKFIKSKGLLEEYNAR